MTVGDIIKLVKFRYGHVSLANNSEAVISFINLGVAELYRRFNLLLRSETILLTAKRAIYELRNPDVSIMLHLYFEDGKELIQTDVVDANEWDYRQVNYRSFVLRKPFEGLLYAVYKADPVLFKDTADTVDLPMAMVDALLAYVGYSLHGTVNSATNSIGRFSYTYLDEYKRFESLCQQLEMQGYKIPLSAETLRIVARGYI